MKNHLPRFFPRLLALLAMAGAADGQIFVATNSSSVREYNSDGTLANGSYVTGLSGPLGMAVSGTGLFIVNSANNTISESMTTGGGASLLVPSSTGALSQPTGIAVSGSTLFVTNFSAGTVSTFSTSGTTLNSSLLYLGPGSSPTGIAVMGNYLFVSHSTGVDEYLLNGTHINSTIMPLNGYPAGLAVVGSTLYIAGGSNYGVVNAYTFDSGGAQVGSPVALISGLSYPYAIATDNTYLYVGGYNNGAIGEYNLDGSVVNVSLISGLGTNYGFGLAVVAVPEPAACAAWLGLGALGFAAYRRRHRQPGR